MTAESSTPNNLGAKEGQLWANKVTMQPVIILSVTRDHYPFMHWGVSIRSGGPDSTGVAHIYLSDLFRDFYLCRTEYDSQ
jgi:hypothetical protein